MKKLGKSPGSWHFRVGKIPDQVVRLAVIFAIGIVVLLLARQRFIPASFGELGHYRADAVGEVASQQIRYAGWQGCTMCHQEVTDKKLGSYHRTLSCEVCHGPGAEHAENPVERLPVIQKKRDACLRCHSYLPSRPTGFPQILELQHNPLEACIHCHNPHDPTPPEVPSTCSACHGQIARTKAISHHHELDCETCHQSPPEHRENPRLHLPTKPATREFCGQCHAEGAAVPVGITTKDLSRREIPHVDLQTHGNTYLCWQCHYPHFPEGR